MCIVVVTSRQTCKGLNKSSHWLHVSCKYERDCEHPPPSMCMHVCPQSKNWRHCVGRTVELVQVQRQADQQFIAILQSIRVGR